MPIYRQGDVAFNPIQKDEENLSLKEKNLNKFTVAKGEATGHHHTLNAEKESIDVYENEGGDLVLDIKEDTNLNHQQHNDIKIEKGMYVITKEREYDYFNDIKVDGDRFASSKLNKVREVID